MDVFVRSGDDRNLVTQIHDQLRDAIADGRSPIGARLTPSRMLAAELEVSLSTVTDAYERLAAEGYVEGRRGGGTVVVGGALPRPPNRQVSDSEVVPTPDAATIGRYGDPVGSPALRRAVTPLDRQARGIATTPDRVVATQGTGQTIDLPGRALLRPGDVAAVEEAGLPARDQRVAQARASRWSACRSTRTAWWSTRCRPTPASYTSRHRTTTRSAAC